MSEPAQILCVDDEQSVLDGLRRNLRRHFAIETALGPEAGLEALETRTFAVVLSDYQMPGMNGAEFLAQVRKNWPETTRMLLTGNADLDAAIDTVNEGQIYRFLLKPCPRDKLVPVLEEGLDRYRLVTSERVLLQETLHGAIRFLTDALAMASPADFSRAGTVASQAGRVAEALGVESPWQVEMATLLAQVLLVTLPDATLRKLRDGEPLTSKENEIVTALPQSGSALLAHLPRIEPVLEMVLKQGPVWGSDAPAPEAPPVGASILRASIDLDRICAQGVPFGAAMASLRERTGVVPDGVLDALEGALKSGGSSTREVSVYDLAAGMTLLEPIQTVDGRLLIAEGSELSPATVTRIKNFLANTELKDPVRVEG